MCSVELESLREDDESLSQFKCLTAAKANQEGAEKLRGSDFTIQKFRSTTNEDDEHFVPNAPF